MIVSAPSTFVKAVEVIFPEEREVGVVSRRRRVDRAVIGTCLIIVRAQVGSCSPDACRLPSGGRRIVRGRLGERSRVRLLRVGGVRGKTRVFRHWPGAADERNPQGADA